MGARRTGRVIAASMTVGLLVAACDGDEGSSPPGPTSTPTVQSAPETDGVSGTATAAPQDGAVQTTAAAGAAIPELARVPCEGALREPTDLEQGFLVEAGPFSGEDYDAEAVAEAVRGMQPQTQAQWSAAIRSQIQDGYADGVCRMLMFDPEIAAESGSATAAPAADAEQVGRNHFALVLDASGSMAAPSGSGTQMDEAKAAISTFVDELPEESTVSLRIYGHEGTNTEEGKAESCASSEVVFTGEPADPGFADALAGVQPVGYTPLALAIGDAQGDIPQETTDAIMYVVSDGLETCGGDPVGAAREVADSGVNPIINVIGFHVDNADQQALREIAQAGGGEFTTADSGAELEEYWRAEQERVRAAWRAWQEAEFERLAQAKDENVREVTEVSDVLREMALTDRVRGREVSHLLHESGDIDSHQLRFDVDRAMWLDFQHLAQRAIGWGDTASRESRMSWQAAWSTVYLSTDQTWTDLYRAEQDRR